MNIQTGANPNVHSHRREVTLSQTPAPAPAQPPAQPAVPDPGRPGSGFLDTVTRGLVTLTYESAAVVQNDPALAVREFATRVHEMSSRGYGSSDLTAWAPYVGVGARTLILGANVLRAQKTIGGEGAGLLEKGLDALRVTTDLLGVAGAVMRVVSPTYAPLGTTLMGIAQSADLVSHGARFGMHSAPRVTSWLKDHEEKKAREKQREKKAIEAQGLT